MNIINQRSNKKIISINSQVGNKYLFKDNKFTLKPDIIINFENKEKLIIDTKYKILDKNKQNYGVSTSDIYQMFAYGTRYFGNNDFDFEKNIILLYPEYDESFNSENIKYKSTENINIYIKTLNLKNMDLSCKGCIETILGEISHIIN